MKKTFNKIKEIISTDVMLAFLNFDKKLPYTLMQVPFS